MQRQRATHLLTGMIDRLERGEWPVNLVEEVYLFGSYARGALRPGDVDIVIQHTTDQRWLEESLHASINGWDSYTSMKQGLRGRTRGTSFQFQERDWLTEEGFELTLLWKKGEPFDIARLRLDQIPADPAAGSAPRDHMLPAFEALAQIPPRPTRIQIHQLHEAGCIDLARIDLADAMPTDVKAVRHLRRRWSQTSPLQRAGACALAYLESAGVHPHKVELHGKLLHGAPEEVEYFVDLEWRYFSLLQHYLAEGQSWLEIPHPHRTKPIDALLIQPRAASAVTSH